MKRKIYLLLIIIILTIEFGIICFGNKDIKKIKIVANKIDTARQLTENLEESADEYINEILDTCE